MKKKITLRWSARLIIVVLLILSIVMLALIYISQGKRSLESKPLVLIHSPLNREPFQVGERISVHATARGVKGLSSVELWVNDTFVDAHNAPGEDSTNSLVLSSSWLATTAGSNVVIVRAIAADGTAGQASVVITVSEREGEVAGMHTARQGDTFRSIADEYSLDPGLLELANPGLDPEDLDPGDEIIIPDDEEPPAEGDPPADDPPADDPPFPEGAAPESGFRVPGVLDDYILSPVQDLFLLPAQDYILGLLGTDRADDQNRLRLEMLSLTTSHPFEELYLYVSYGDFPQHRFPDDRDDLGIGESIPIISTEADGTTTWDLSAAAENAIPIFDWPLTQDLPFSLTLVGVIEGGINSVEMYFMDFVSPSYWTGMILSCSVEDGEYSFAFTYQISPAEGGGRGFEAYIDEHMTPPDNARIDNRRQSLRWSYEPRPDEERIDGFRIYLNGSLQWVEPARSRESRLPPEWFNPPCGTTYVFAVTAYRIGIPDGPESLRSIAILEPEAENCQREIAITFLELETFDLGGDGDRPPHWGDVGPVYGHFYANEQRILFDTRVESNWRWGGFDRPYGFNHHTRYNLAEMAADPAWNFSGRPVLLVEIPEDGSFQFGFHFMDQDYGRCRRPSDPGCDDLIAEASSSIYSLTSAAGRARFDRQNEGVLVADNGRCQVSYVWGPAFGSPVGSGVEGWEPLPWIELERFEVDDSSGQVRLHVRNIGTATWPYRDLKVELQNRDGSSIGVYTWPNFALEPGLRTVLEQPGMRLDPPFDACVLIDPYDDVLEEHEHTLSMNHIPICEPAPDLIITDVGFIPGESTGQLAVTIWNRGAGPVSDRTVSFEAYAGRAGRLDLGDAATAAANNVALGRFQTTTLIIGEISEATRAQMRDGYQVVVNPDNRIYESNTDNNTFEVPAGGRLDMRVYEINAPWSMRNNVNYQLTAYIVSGQDHARREVVNIRISDPDWSTRSRQSGCYTRFGFVDNNVRSDRFFIFGDEILEITVSGSHRRDSWTYTNTYLPRDKWRADDGTGMINPHNPNPHTGQYHTWLLHRVDRQHRLSLTFLLCGEW